MPDSNGHIQEERRCVDGQGADVGLVAECVAAGRRESSGRAQGRVVVVKSGSRSRDGVVGDAGLRRAEERDTAGRRGWFGRSLGGRRPTGTMLREMRYDTQVQEQEQEQSFACRCAPAGNRQDGSRTTNAGGGDVAQGVVSRRRKKSGIEDKSKLVVVMVMVMGMGILRVCEVNDSGKRGKY